ncbi:protein prenylyltransferase [Hypoxylon fragiforme]|uniref:protein prenylyltransferase n=1 Tax=Hypoxylon fragiforme TaxID=63214 RepID=UPI0020C5D205|nr:protein prenylyltransferase [Hypoxylon fragiforme]KAI2611348.1 protein prenylyltransferase [Hypoxylon fragiforme]
MDSHGAPRTSRIARTEEHRRQDTDKINKYRELEASIRLQADAQKYDDNLFQLTSKLLRLNPEYYTIWNVRRRCLIYGLSSAPSHGSSPSKESLSTSPQCITNPCSDSSSPTSLDTIPQSQDSQIAGKNGITVDSVEGNVEDNVEAHIDTIQNELSFTIPLLVEFPKCYWIWKYRKWLLEQANTRLPPKAARSIWETELGLASKMLAKDRRNFHAWGYRRYVVAALENPLLGGRSMVEDEFAYTTKMIRGDLSNFSAWHSRSQLLLRLLEERGADDAARKAFLDEELGLIQDALNVGPDDQSLWYYHQYMMSQIVQPSEKSTIAPALTTSDRIAYVRGEIDNIKDLLEDYADTKWIYEALLEYTIALKHLGQNEGEELDVEDPKQWLAKVRALDPMRAGRWNDIEKQLGSNQH